MNKLSFGSLDRYRFLLFAWLTAAVIGTLVLFALRAATIFTEVMRPDFEAKAVLISESVAVEFERIAALNIAVTDVRQVAVFLEDQIEAHPEVIYAAVSIPSENVLLATGKLTKDKRITPLLMDHVNAKAVGAKSIVFGNVIDITTALSKDESKPVFLHIGVDEAYARTKLIEIAFDIFITLFVAAVITLEVLFFAVLLTLDRQSQAIKDFVYSVNKGVFPALPDRRSSPSALMRALETIIGRVNDRYRKIVSQTKATAAGSPGVLSGMRGRFQFAGVSKSSDDNGTIINMIRLPTFLFFFAADLTRPFWPNFVATFTPPVPGFDINIMMAIPMALWGLTTMLVTPLGPRMLRNLGLRNALLVGMIPSAIGSLMCGLASGYIELVFWRSIGAIGFGLMSVLGVLYVASVAKPGRAARDAAVFIGAQTAAGVCGTAMGGILAELIGYSGAMLFAAFLTISNATLVWLTMKGGADSNTANSAMTKASNFKADLSVVRSWNFALFVGLVALPPRIVLTGFMLLMVPVSLHRFEFSDAAVGRFMMVCFMANLILTPVLARIIDKYKCHRTAALTGSFFLAMAVITFTVTQQVWSLTLAMVLVGFGLALTTTTLISIVPSQFGADVRAVGLGPVTALIRTSERIGSVLGPIVAALLAQAVGFVTGARYLGIALLACSIMLAVYFYITRTQSEPIGSPA